MDMEGTAMGLEGRLEGLAQAASILVMNGWAPERATIDPEEAWSAGEVVATASTDAGETMVYSLHLAPDGEHWWHSVEMVFVQARRWVKSPPLDYVAVVDVAERMLANRRRAKEEVDAEFHRLFESHGNG